MSPMSSFSLRGSSGTSAFQRTNNSSYSANVGTGNSSTAKTQQKKVFLSSKNDDKYNSNINNPQNQDASEQQELPPRTAEGQQQESSVEDKTSNNTAQFQSKHCGNNESPDVHQDVVATTASLLEIESVSCLKSTAKVRRRIIEVCDDAPPQQQPPSSSGYSSHHHHDGGSSQTRIGQGAAIFTGQNKSANYSSPSGNLPPLPLREPKLGPQSISIQQLRGLERFGSLNRHICTWCRGSIAVFIDKKLKFLKIIFSRHLDPRRAGEAFFSGGLFNITASDT